MTGSRPNIRTPSEVRDRLAALVGSSVDAITAQSLDGIVLDWNQGAERLYGYSESEMVGRSIHAIVPEGRTEECSDLLRRALAGERIQSFETVRVRRDGSLVPISMTLSQIKGDDGQLLGLSCIARDLSERQRIARRELEVHLELERVAQANMAVSEAFAELSQTGIRVALTAIVRQARALTGAHCGALGIGTDSERPFDPWVFDCDHCAPPRSAGAAPRPVGLLGIPAREGHSVRVADIRREADYRGLPGGHPEIESLMGIPIRYRGQAVGNLYLANKDGGFSETDERIVGMLATRIGRAIETAKLYESEAMQRARLQAMFDQMPDAVVITDATGVVLQQNRAAVDLAPDASPERPMPLDLRLPSGALLPAEASPIARALAEGEPIVGEERLVRAPDGRFVAVLASATPLRTEQGVVGAVAIYRNIQARKELDRMREEWAAIVAHDLRQPVSIIAMCSAMLHRLHAGLLSENELKIIGAIRSSATKLNRMIGDLTDVSAIDSHRLALDRSPVNVCQLVLRHIEEMRQAMPGAQLRCVPSAEGVAWVDPDRIQQVVGNLVTNAVKYGERGAEVVVDIGGDCDDVRVSVTNRGPGIPAEQLPLLFERFARTPEARRKPGLGLGLYIARGIVTAHSGRIWAESTVGETTRFQFTIPRLPPPRWAKIRTSYQKPGLRVGGLMRVSPARNAGGQRRHAKASSLRRFAAGCGRGVGGSPPPEDI